MLEYASICVSIPKCSSVCLNVLQYAFVFHIKEYFSGVLWNTSGLIWNTAEYSGIQWNSKEYARLFNNA